MNGRNNENITYFRFAFRHKAVRSAAHGKSAVFIEQIEDIICDYGIGAVAVAGDVFDSSVANSEAITAYNDFAVKICGKLGIKMIVIAGNHDSAARLGMTSALLENSGL